MKHAVPLLFVGIDPDTGKTNSPTVWVDQEKRELVFQGWDPDPQTLAECADFERRRATGERDTDPASAYWAPWVDLIGRTRARGVVVRRARIVSEPVSEYLNHFTGDGASAGAEITEAPEAAKLCASAFEAVWDRAIPHDRYGL
jgi:hypothetical protein